MKAKEKNWTKSELSNLQYEIIGAAIEVHKHMGPGLLESIYHKCMIHELTLRGLNVRSEVKIRLEYKDLVLNNNEELRCDLLVEEVIVVELKTVDTFIPVHESILLSYMRLAQKPKGLLINFKCSNLSDSGYKSFVNGFYRLLPD